MKSWIEQIDNNEEIQKKKKSQYAPMQQYALNYLRDGGAETSVSLVVSEKD